LAGPQELARQEVDPDALAERRELMKAGLSHATPSFPLAYAVNVTWRRVRRMARHGRPRPLARARSAVPGRFRPLCCRCEVGAPDVGHVGGRPDGRPGRKVLPL